jgi:membrane protease YdiL (CAAX protease family)
MSAAVKAWGRIAALTTVAVALLVGLAPTRPADRLSWLPGAGTGAVAGAALCVVVTGRRLQAPRVAASLLTARCGILGLLAADEEIVWRRAVLGELMFGGAVAALAASTLGFAIAHRVRPGLHLLTGITFGGLYVATGTLAASIAAHWAYNVLVGWPTADGREPDGAPP